MNLREEITYWVKKYHPTDYNLELVDHIVRIIEYRLSYFIDYDPDPEYRECVGCKKPVKLTDNDKVDMKLYWTAVICDKCKEELKNEML